ncbi:MAG: hypothetical protein U9O78_03500, partial [Patescibacteria group bacterium]|nr:hypothetical protein [Patescibacteria group bacterium]
MKKNQQESLEAAIKGETKGSPSLFSFTTKTFQGAQHAIMFNVGGPPKSALSAMTEEEREVAYSIYGHGAISAVGGHIASLYQPPASGVRYVADVFESAKLIPQAQAQGTGFAALNPILETWKTFRNVAYLFFVLIFLVIGFMIMFRHKINGQTVITVQQAIPNIIVSLIFVTFSYAIAGFLIDLMYVLMYLFIGLFNGSEKLIN